VGFGEEIQSKKSIHGRESQTLDKKPVVTFIFKYRPLEILRATDIVQSQVKRKRAAVESPEPAIKDEATDSDAEETKVLEEKLNAIREKKANKVKRIKTESKTPFISGEIIDLT